MSKTKAVVKATPKKVVKTKAVAVLPRLPVKVELDPQALMMEGIKNGVSIDVMERLMQMRDKLRQEQAERDFRSAMSAFQGECPVIQKKRVVKDKSGRTRYKYASIDDIIDQVGPILEKHGLSYDVDTAMTPEIGMISITVTAYHVGGYRKSSNFVVPYDKEAYMTEPQKWASAQTFGKRYAFMNVFGIVTGDMDDDTSIIGQMDQLNQDDVDKKINALPQNIKDGFKVLGYGKSAAVLFCDKFNWDNAVIIREINRIVDSKNVKV